MTKSSDETWENHGKKKRGREGKTPQRGEALGSASQDEEGTLRPLMPRGQRLGRAR